MSDVVNDHFQAKRAANYDETVRKVIPGYTTLHAMSRFLLRDALPAQADILIVGCGTGTELIEMGKSMPGWSFTGVDPSAPMLEVAKARVAEAGLADRVTLHCARCDELPKDKLFDAATCLLVMHFLPDGGPKMELMISIAERLKPNAPLLLADLHGPSDSQRYARLMRAWRHWQENAGIDPVEIEKGFRHIEKDIHFVSEKRLFDIFHHAGFKDIEHFHQAFLFGGWLAFKA